MHNRALIAVYQRHHLLATADGGIIWCHSLPGQPSLGRPELSKCWPTSSPLLSFSSAAQRPGNQPSPCPTFCSTSSNLASPRDRFHISRPLHPLQPAIKPHPSTSTQYRVARNRRSAKTRRAAPRLGHRLDGRPRCGSPYIALFRPFPPEYGKHSGRLLQCLLKRRISSACERNVSGSRPIS